MLYANKPCSDCGGEKKGCYEKESYCGPCLSKRRKIIRAQNALLNGTRKKAPNGSGRSKLCSKCGKEKDDAFLSSGYCRECKLKSNKEKTLAKRLAAGLQPWGSGLRPAFCYNCKKTKENPKAPFCRECKNEKERELRKRNINSDPNFYIKERKKYKKIGERDPMFKLKKRVRTFTYKCIMEGLLIPKPCEVCNEDKVDAHHDDYTKPLDVRWLCREHHNEHHRKETV